MALEILAAAAEKIAETGATVAKKSVEVSAEAIERSSEFSESHISETALRKDGVLEPDIRLIKETSLKSLMASNMESFNINSRSLDAECALEIEHADLEKVGLTDEQKALIIKETGWPPEIAECIQSMEQYEVYKEANLRYAEIDGRPCLIKDLDMDYADPKTGLTNRALLEKGRPPIDTTTGERIELHHMGQNFDSPFAELCENSEHGDGKDGILHDKQVESWRNDPVKKNEYNNHQRPNHWKARAKEGEI